MPGRFLFCALVCGAFFLGNTAVCAGDEAPAKAAPVEFEDDATRKLFADWQAKLHHAGRAGIKNARCKLKGSVAYGQMEEPLEIKGKFSWDAAASEPAKLEWSPDKTTARLTRMGWDAARFAQSFDPNDFERKLAGGKLSAHTEGDETIVSVEGPTAEGFRRFVFDKQGVLQLIYMEQPGKDEQTVKIEVRMAFKTEGEKLVTTGWASIAEVPFKGTVESLVRVENKKVKGQFLWSKVEELVRVEGNPIAGFRVELYDWELNGASTKDKADE